MRRGEARVIADQVALTEIAAPGFHEAARAEADLLLVPPGGVSLLPAGGVMFDVRGRFVAPRLGVALEIPAFPLGGALTTAWRLEAEGFGYAVERAWSDEVGSKTVQARGNEDVLGGTLLLGISAQRPLGRAAELLASLSGGAALARSSPPDTTTPALLHRTWTAPKRRYARSASAST